MNTLNQMPRRPFSCRTGIGGVGMVALLSLASVVAAHADPPAIPSAPTHSAKVSLAGLDLATPAGARVAYERIKRVAERLCDDREDSWSRYQAAAYNTCVRETVADAVHQIHAAAMVALEN
jgi:UrcA family protein